MILLTTQAMPQMRAHEAPELGRLVTPRHFPSIREHGDGLVWAADNDCYQGLDPARWCKMLDAVAAQSGAGALKFCTAPDKVGDARETRAMFDRWAPELERRRLPIGYVLQDGLELERERERIPWDSIAAVFVGGFDGFKLSQTARELVRDAKRRGLWAHMGRVNSYCRMEKADGWGVDSVDGTGWILHRDANLDRGIRYAAAINAQTRLELSV